MPLPFFESLAGSTLESLGYPIQGMAWHGVDLGMEAKTVS